MLTSRRLALLTGLVLLTVGAYALNAGHTDGLPRHLLRQPGGDVLFPITGGGGRPSHTSGPSISSSRRVDRPSVSTSHIERSEPRSDPSGSRSDFPSVSSSQAHSEPRGVVSKIDFKPEVSVHKTPDVTGPATPIKHGDSESVLVPEIVPHGPSGNFKPGKDAVAVIDSSKTTVTNTEASKSKVVSETGQTPVDDKDKQSTADKGPKEGSTNQADAGKTQVPSSSTAPQSGQVPPSSTGPQSGDQNTKEENKGQGKDGAKGQGQGQDHNGSGKGTGKGNEGQGKDGGKDRGQHRPPVNPCKDHPNDDNCKHDRPCEKDGGDNCKPRWWHCRSEGRCWPRYVFFRNRRWYGDDHWYDDGFGGFDSDIYVFSHDHAIEINDEYEDECDCLLSDWWKWTDDDGYVVLTYDDKAKCPCCNCWVPDDGKERCPCIEY